MKFLGWFKEKKKANEKSDKTEQLLVSLAILSY